MLDFVVFSKDRPAQLELLLRSLKRFVAGWRDLGLTVIHVASDERFAAGYARVRELHPEPRWIDEHAEGRPFRELALGAVGARPLTAFLMDDQLFKAPFSVEAPQIALLDDPRVLCVSLRMDPGMDYCYPLDRTTAVPRFERGTVWDWTHAEGDWGYPMSLDAHVFRTEQLLDRMRELLFANPNTLEAALAAGPGALAGSPLAACLPIAPTVNVPANRVQTVCDNRHAQGDAGALNEAFLAGRRLALAPLAGVRTRAPHAELPLRWQDEPGVPPAVSVVIPCFQYGRHLTEAVESVMTQDVDEVEVLVVDDGSTDDTLAVARDLVARHPGRIRLLHQANSGHPARSRNAGLAATRGTYVLCLDADDRIAPGFLAATVAGLDAHPAAGFAYGDQRDFDGGETVHTTPPYDFAALTNANFLSTATLFRRAAWEAAGGFDPAVGYEDWDFWIGCGAAGWHGVKAERAVFEYRAHGHGVYAADAAADVTNKARILLKRPHLYTETQVAWARAVLAGDATALALPTARGTLPRFAEPEAPAAAPAGESAAGARSFATLAFADELVAHPELIAAYAERFRAQDDATLVIYAPGADPEALGRQLEPVLASIGLDGPEAPDLLALALPRDAPAEPVAAGASAVFTRREPQGAFAGLARFDDVTADALRALAEQRWQAPPPPPPAAPGSRLPAAPAPVPESPMERLYRRFVAPGDVVFDVGANLGNRTETFLALGARVVAVEPQAELANQLRHRWDGEARLDILECALADEHGERELFVSDAHTLTTMATDWIDEVKASGRFSEYRWDEKRIVTTETLARLIARYGEPAFCKIDVEGFEEVVLAGLDRPLRAVSLEFSCERLHATRACLERLAALGPIACNYSLGESMELELDDWAGADELLTTLAALPGHLPWGDVYVRALSPGDAATQELRAAVAALPPLPEVAGGETDYWLGKRRELRELIATRDPHTMLGWGPLVETMVVAEASYVTLELEALRADPAWASRWEPAVQEDAAGEPPRLSFYPASSGNLVTHAYHAWAWERATGRRIDELARVVEFGGGYGSMVRLLRRLGYSGRHHVHDLPELGALQRWFVRTTLAQDAGVTCSDRLEDAPDPAGGLFLGTWSLSEVPPAVRDAWRPLLAGCSSFLIGYQATFERIDNRAWFEAFAASRPDVRWTHHEIPHIPGNYYLLGSGA